MANSPILEVTRAVRRLWATPGVSASTIAAGVLLIAACGGGSSNSTEQMPADSPATPGPVTASTPRSPGLARVAVAQAGELGDILADGTGRTVYLFEKDTGTTSTCYDACAAAWPPVTTSVEPTAAPGVDQAKLGTTARRDGTTQVTFKGHPLYYYVGDTSPGQATGQDIDQFGAEWYALTPAGDKAG